MNRLNILTQALKATKATASWDAIFLRNLEWDPEEEIKAKPYTKSSIIYTCISTTARTIAQVPLVIMTKSRSKDNMALSRIGVITNDRVYRRRDMGFGNLVSVTKSISGKGIFWEQVNEDYPWQILFDNPNYLMSANQMKECIVGYLMLHGNAWLVGYPTARTVIPSSIWPVKKDYISSVVDKKTGNLEGWKYKPSDYLDAIHISLDEYISHFKFFNPNDVIMGMSPLDSGKIPMTADYRASVYNSNFYKNSAIPGGALVTDKPLNRTQVSELKERWKEDHQGEKRSHELAVLHSNLKYEQFALNQSDMQYLEGRKWNRDEICQILGMKKGVISITEDLNYATLMGQKKEWWESTLIPIMTLVEDSINSTFFRNIPDIKIMFDLSGVKALQEDLKEKTETARIYFDMGVPFNQINERLKLGFDILPGRDVGHLPIHLVPVTEMEEEEIGPVVTPDEEPEEEPEEEEGKVYISKRLEKKGEMIWKGITQISDRLEDDYKKKVRRVFFEMRNNVLSILYTGKPKKSKQNKDITEEELIQNIDELNKYNFEIEEDLLRKYSGPAYITAIEEGAKFVSAEIGIDVIPDIIQNPLVILYIENRKNKVTKVIDTVREQIKGQIGTSLEAGEGITKISKKIKNTFDFASNRSKTIARTEVFSALNFGRHSQIVESGFKIKIWYTALDERVRYSHIFMHGKKIGVNEDWDVGGATLKYPGDYSGPASEIINCRCIEIVDTEEG